MLNIFRELLRMLLLLKAAVSKNTLSLGKGGQFESSGDLGAINFNSFNLLSRKLFNIFNFMTRTHSNTRPCWECWTWQGNVEHVATCSPKVPTTFNIDDDVCSHNFQLPHVNMNNSMPREPWNKGPCWKLTCFVCFVRGNVQHVDGPKVPTTFTGFYDFNISRPRARFLKPELSTRWTFSTCPGRGCDVWNHSFHHFQHSRFVRRPCHLNVARSSGGATWLFSLRFGKKTLTPKSGRNSGDALCLLWCLLALEPCVARGPSSQIRPGALVVPSASLVFCITITEDLETQIWPGRSGGAFWLISLL